MKNTYKNAWNLFEYEFFIFFFLKNAYNNAWNLFVFCFFFIDEGMKFFWLNLKMHAWMHEIWFFCYVLNDVFVNALNFWLNLNFWFEWKCMFEYIKFNFLFLLKSAFMNAWKWNFVNFFEWKCLFECMKFFLSFWFCSFFYFFNLFFLRMYLWIHGTLWILWMKMHLWMYETLWIFWMKICAWMHEFFSFSWMIMHILKHEILFFIFIFLNDNAWNSIFLYVQILKWFYKWFFFSVNFSKTMFQKDMYEFSKREDMYKRYFQWFLNVWKFMYKGIFFNDFF